LLLQAPAHTLRPANTHSASTSTALLCRNARSTMRASKIASSLLRWWGAGQRRSACSAVRVFIYFILF
jgi:hypothetical protein